MIDVPNDQGGYLYLSFNRSAYDTDILTNTVFDLYSDDFDDELFFANFGSEGYVIERFDNEVWTAVQSLFAYGSDTYQVEVRTLSDSTSVSNSLAEYRVIAAMTEGNFESLSTVIGYSVDNIAPMVPTSFTGSYDSELGRAVLSWDPSNANDISHYNVYKNETLYTSINDITFSENIVGDAEYSISAVDIHENESMLTEPVYMAELSINEELIITDFRLLPAYPNPFNPITTIQYSLPNYSKILIQVYNSNGALVSELVNSSMQAGEYSITWDAADHASGIYFVKMIAGDFLQNQKLILMK